MHAVIESLKTYIRDVPDFPTKGILFKDFTPLLQDGKAFRKMVSVFASRYCDNKPDKIVAVESRGFILGAALAYELAIGLVPVRKPGKLPYKTFAVQYALEYGTDILEIHQDAVNDGETVIIVDDLLATGGTADAAAQLVEMCGARVMEVACLIELVALSGRKRLGRYPVETLIQV
jgi:adenine phosphoribosyltransferase